ncbi:MAG: hypothetical protein LBV67_09310, partial [Streptococcaceae bacterium]|nr:hypothetical protein [Streptococcaceae bacterium]
MKKNLSLIFLLFFVFFIKSTFVFANDDDLKSHANFNLGTTKLPDGRSFIARNPFDPKLPFPANSIYKESHSSLFGTILVDGQNHWGQVEFDLEGQSEATTQYPKLYSWREYLLNPSDEASDYNENWEQKTGIKNAGLVHVPVRWGF